MESIITYSVYTPKHGLDEYYAVDGKKTHLQDYNHFPQHAVCRDQRSVECSTANNDCSNQRSRMLRPGTQDAMQTANIEKCRKQTQGSQAKLTCKHEGSRSGLRNQTFPPICRSRLDGSSLSHTLQLRAAYAVLLETNLVSIGRNKRKCDMPTQQRGPFF